MDEGKKAKATELTRRDYDRMLYDSVREVVLHLGGKPPNMSS